MSIHEQIKNEIKEAMKAKDTVKLSVVRGLVSAFTNEAVAKGGTPTDILSDADALAVIKRAANQRKDAIDQFVAGGRPELAESEQTELAVLQTYLPAMMPLDEVRKVAQAKKAELGIDDKAKSGQLVGMIMKDLAGKADGADVKTAVDELFA
jgi:uncharacterized protein